MLRTLFASAALIIAQSTATPLSIMYGDDTQFAQVGGPTVAELSAKYAPKPDVTPAKRTDVGPRKIMPDDSWIKKDEPAPAPAPAPAVDKSKDNWWIDQNLQKPKVEPTVRPVGKLALPKDSPFK